MTTPDTRDSVELLPCPFCGGQAEALRTGDDQAYVGCSSCGMYTGEVPHGWAIAAWNRRALPQQAGGEDVLQAEVARLREAGRDAELLKNGIRQAFAAMQSSYQDDRRILLGELDIMFDLANGLQFRLVRDGDSGEGRWAACADSA